jgi:signal transduction histidine kinase/CHASE1-domain containing sensor protein
MRFPWKSPITPYVVLLLVLSLTTVAALFARANARLHRQTRFESTAESIRNDIVARLQTYQNILVETRGVFHAAPHLTRAQFRTYVEDLRLFEIYPGVLGLGFSERVPGNQIDAYEERVKKEGFPNFNVWPRFPRSEYFVITYMEPFAWRNRRAFGYDMFTDPTRQLAMIQARDTGNSVATPAVTLVQEERLGMQPGFLIYVPIYRTGMVPPTLEQRRRELRGFVYSPFRVADLLNAIFPAASHPAPLAFEVAIDNYDGSTKSVYAYEGHAAAAGSELKKEFQLNVSGRPWHIIVRPSEGFLKLTDESLPLVITIAGASLALLCFWLLRSQLANAQAEAERSQQLALLNQMGRTLSSQLDVEKLVQEVTDAGRELSGAAFGAFFYVNTDERGEDYVLYALSGVAREKFARFPMPRRTALLGPSFLGEGIKRSDDILKDPNYGKSGPHLGLPAGHLPVRSYLAVPVKSRSGDVLGVLFYGHPEPARFSEREEQLVAGMASHAAVAMDNARLFKNAQEAVQTRDEFLRIASHELKTPLTPLKLHMQGLTRSVNRGLEPNPEALAKMAKVADLQITRISKLVDDLLDVSRISAGLLKLNPERVDLSQLVQEVVDRFSPQLAETGMEVIREIEPGLEGSYDHLRLEQVVANLITNAIKYAPEAPLTVTLRREGPEVVLVVADQGAGVDPSNHEKVFERFERAGFAKSSAVGLGLGLYITRQIVDAHGGTIRLQSRQPHGARFEIRLPAGA